MGTDDVGWTREEGEGGVPRDSGSSDSASDIHFWIFGRDATSIDATCCAGGRAKRKENERPGMTAPHRTARAHAQAPRVSTLPPSLSLSCFDLSLSCFDLALLFRSRSRFWAPFWFDSRSVRRGLLRWPGLRAGVCAGVRVCVCMRVYKRRTGV